MNRRRRRVIGGKAPGGYDAAAVTLFAAMATDPGATRKGLYNDLIVGLKADGLWTRMDALYLFAAHEAATALLNIRQPGTYNAAEVNVPTFTTDRGYTCTGTAHLDTNFNPATAVSPQHVQNSSGFYAYSNFGTSDLGSTLPLCGHANGAGALIFLRPRNASDFLDTRVHSTTGSSFSPVTTRLGGSAVMRTGAAAVQGYKNGAAVGTLSTAASSAPASFNTLCMRWNTTYNTNDRIAAFAITAGLDATETANLHSRCVTFLTAIGAN